MEKVYIAIDLKSFYASCECQERGLNPLTTNLVVADKSRTEKTICLAVSPSLKAYGIPGRARLFEVLEKVKEINKERLKYAKNHKFIGKSFNDIELKENPNLELDFVIATPQMSHYINVSTNVYETYLKYISKNDIHVYSIDEVFMDVTNYLKLYNITPHELAMKMVKDVLKKTGITATAGIGSNLYLAKVAMDIVAKHIEADSDGVRIAELDVLKYRELLWDHKPLKDFWRVGHGIANKLEKYGIYTMGDIARKSIEDEDLLYNLFGVNAELLIDHAWGYEPVTIEDIKNYKPKASSLSSGQVLSCPYDYKKGLLIILEMTDLLVLDLVSKNLLCDQVVLNIGYETIANTPNYEGETSFDYIGRLIPKSGHGSINLGSFTSSTKIILDSVKKLYKKICNPNLQIRRVNVCFNNLISNDVKINNIEQLDIFTDFDNLKEKTVVEEKRLETENKLQKTIVDLHNKFGKNSVIKGMNLEEGATTIERNNQIGGHRK